MINKASMSEMKPKGGNKYPKYTTTNPVARYLMNGFVAKLDIFVASINPASIHEIGCGEGHLISRFVKEGRILKGSDISAKIIAVALQKYENRGVQFKEASVYDLSSRDSAGLILCCEVFEHLEHPDKALDIFADIAQPYLIASVPREPIWRILNLFRGAYWKTLGNTPDHIQHWSKRGFIHFLHRRFEIIEIANPFPWTMVLCRTGK